MIEVAWADPAEVTEYWDNLATDACARVYHILAPFYTQKKRNGLLLST